MGDISLLEAGVLSWSPCHADERALLEVIIGCHFYHRVLSILYSFKACFGTKLNFQLNHLVTNIYLTICYCMNKVHMICNVFFLFIIFNKYITILLVNAGITTVLGVPQPLGHTGSELG